MVCEKCEKKLGKVITPDSWKDGARNTTGPKFNPPLYIQRYEMVRDIIIKENPPIVRVADFGCAEGRFIRYLKQLPFVEEIAAIDIDKFNLEESQYVASPLFWEHMFGRYVALTINLYEGNVVEPDCRLKEFDAVTCIELVEHLDFEVLNKFPANIFGYLKPRLVIITTPNRDFNVLFPQLKADKFRHWDHKFEWTRQQFNEWCSDLVSKYPDYHFEITGVGKPPEGQENVGNCSQIAIFRRTIPVSILNDNLPCNYKLFDSYYYPKRDKKEEKNLEPIDWDSVLKN
ncbi:Small RNA 2' [Dinothrombium tinctorium]|uniref:Small RNA 2'-O-methyltransferase n=1 Tax=Dinothrombium tinctorium TaxID=1965070 RepID=A0A443R6F4_9ACAR|nr:Small RNA 2' [Dinothrombium tinctorium]